MRKTVSHGSAQLLLSAVLLVFSSSLAMAELCLPAYISGMSTAFGFSGNFGRGDYKGIVVTDLRVTGAAATIANRAGTVYYSGPLTVGQFIPLPISLDIIWTGYSDSVNHGNGICVDAVY